MPFCPKCKSEFRPDFTRCEECDVVLVAALPVPPPAPVTPPNPGFSTVYSTTEPSDAVLMASLLEGNGIDAEVENALSGLTAIGLPTSAAPVLVIVASADARNAEEIIKQALKTRSTPPGYGSTSKGMWRLAIALILLPILATFLYELFYLLGCRLY